MPSLSSEIERVSVPLLDLKAQYIAIREEVRAAIDRVVESQGFILGPEVAAFEKEIADYSRSAFAVGVSSGTDALLIALMAIGIKPNDEVITTPYSFFATAGSVARLGAKPVFVDIDPATCNLDPSGIEKAITRRTRAILPVHLYGQMAEMEPIMEIAARHDLFVVEDAAQAIGAEYRGRRQRDAGIDEHDSRGGQRRRFDQLRPGTAAEARSGPQAGRHVGAERGGDRLQRRRVLRHSPQPRERKQRRRRVGRAAADAGGERQVLGEREPRAAPVPGVERARRAQNEIVGRIAERGGEGAGDSERQRVGRARLERVAAFGEGEERVEQVVAVGTAADDVEMEIELGRRRDPDRRRRFSHRAACPSPLRARPAASSRAAV